MLTFIHISDTHISSNRHYHPHWVHSSIPHPNDSIRALHERLQDLTFDIDFILHTGDVCADPIDADYHMARDLLLAFDIPVYMLPGNHDSVKLMRDILHDGVQLYVLADQHMTIGDYQLLMLNTNGAGDSHAPLVLDSQIEWLSAQLQQLSDQQIIVALHHPLIETGVKWIDQRMRVQNGQQIHAQLAQYSKQLQGVFHGHIHQPVNSYCDGVLYVGTPSTWYNLQAYPDLQDDETDLLMPGGFNLVMIRDNRTFIRRYVL